MASINKLSIRGVRAFSPDEEEQVISFCFPLTIIVGSNGCGKTTIIESLKYAVTGSLPPGNKSGQAFVHDPKSMNQASVKANIKLRFTNRAGNPMVVVRSMEVTQKKTALTFKALDGIIRTTDPETGQRVSLSHKCTELDRQIPLLMGVSKPILEHVVFCHQEDSSWPLMEGAVLKKRFDDIFDSTRYAKALEAIRKLKNEYTGVVKDLKADQAGLAAHKKAAEGFREELDAAKSQLEDIDDTITNTDEHIAAEEEERDKFQKVIDEIADIHTRSDEIVQQIDIARATAESLREACDDDWTKKHSQEELVGMLATFDDKIEDDERELHKAKREYKTVQKDIEALGEEKMRINADLAKCTAQREQHEKDLRQRQDHMEKMGNEYELQLEGGSMTQGSYGGSLTGGTFGTQQSALSQGTVGTTAGGGRRSIDSVATGLTGMTQDTLVTISGDDMTSFLNAVSKKDAELRSEKEEFQRKAEQEQDDLVKKVSELQARLSTIQNEKTRLKAKIEEALQESQSLKSSGSSHQKIRKGDIDEAKKLAAKARQEADAANSDARMTVIPQEIREAEDKIAALKGQIEDDQRLVTEMRKHEDELREVQMLKRQVENEREVIEEVLKDENSALYKYQVDTTLGEDNGDIYRSIEEKANTVNSAFMLQKDKLDAAERKLSDTQKRLTEKSSLHSHNARQLNQLRAQMQGLSQPNRGHAKIETVIRESQKWDLNHSKSNSTVGTNSDPQQIIDHFSQRIADCKEEYDSPESISRTIKKLKKLAKNTDAGSARGLKCPCCLKAITADDINDFKETMRELADPVNSAIVKMDEALAQDRKEEVELYTKWRSDVQASVGDYLEFKRVNNEIENLEDPVANVETELKTLDEQRKELKDEVSNEQATVTELQTLNDVMNRLRDDASKISRKLSQIKDKELAIGTSSVGANQDLNGIERALSSKNKEKEDLMNDISSLNKESSSLNKRAKEASDKASQLEKSTKAKEEQFEQDQQATVRKNELSELINNWRDEETKLEDDDKPIRRQLHGKDVDLKRLRQTNKTEDDRLNGVLNDFQRDAQMLDDFNVKIDKYLESNKDEAQRRLTDDLNENKEMITEKKKALRDLSPTVNALEKKLDDQSRHKKNLQNNIKVFQQVAKEKDLVAEKAKINEEIELIEGSDDSQAKYNAANKKIRDLEDKRNRAEGRRNGVKDQVKLLKRKLNTEDYKNIDERHRQIMIKTIATGTCADDLGKYYKALDNALLRYHGMKIADINKIIRELWSLTYKGQDINNIQLVSGAEGAAKSARSYNYRVVMTKGTSQMDMRGRCSAGQRVLASIVIRLALAETFCLNCGVMALDEPTTNLDYANKRGLAIALAQIIATRAVQSNFQLVIITHDEDFVSMMKNELSAHTGFNMPERYFQVQREECASDGKFYSKINAVDWDEI
mmetsp:Transcript_16487/g.39219  ORF Transcript_16487/g.39219 Transcript_16487/m.39219 type:complete len:1428 (+) Transcript_16487:133-4416(+)